MTVMAADRSLDVVPLLFVLLLADPLSAAAYAIARRVSSVVEAGSVSHVVVRPAAAAYAPSDDRFGAVSSAALWWTLVTSILLAGGVIASAPLLAAVVGIPPDVLVPLVRLWVLLRLLAMAAGPAAELLETGGFILVRVGLTVAGALFMGVAVLPLALASPMWTLVLLSGGTRAAVELLQAFAAWRRTGSDCTVLSLLRSSSGSAGR